MAFALDAIVGSTTQSLTDGAPFKLLAAHGMGGPPIRRLVARGPAQHGDTDIGYRLQPRDIELQLGFAASTDAILDGYRDLLARIFRPLVDTPVSLRVTRDGPITRQIDVYTVGPIDISLLPEHRPGHYHRARVRVRAPDPTWYDPVPGTATLTGTAPWNNVVVSGVQILGDMPDFPILTLTGPISAPNILNQQSERFRFKVTTTIGAGSVLVIDTRHGRKTLILNGSVNYRSELIPELSHLETWHLEPLGSGQGVNPIYVVASGATTDTKLEVVFHHRYSSY